MKAIYANEESDDELDGGLKPLTARVGGKVLLKKELINNYFPEVSTYKNYVEPFVGAGAVYFYKNKDNKKEVINDIDPKIYQILKGFQKYDAKRLRDDLNGDYTQSDFQKIKESKPSTE
jgi:site-specific DNA-adenine methylase